MHCSVFVGLFELRSMNCPWYEVCTLLIFIFLSFFFFLFVLKNHWPRGACCVDHIEIPSSINYSVFNVWIFCDCFRASHALFFVLLQNLLRFMNNSVDPFPTLFILPSLPKSRSIRFFMDFYRSPKSTWRTLFFSK